jgi:hypothetical protein
MKKAMILFKDIDSCGEENLKETKFETLALTLRKNGFTYTQIHRGQRSCIYRQEVSPDLYYFEVFIIRIKPERIFHGKKIEAREWFPHDEAFGDWAWTFRNYDEALWRFRELEEGKTKEDFTHYLTGKKKYRHL